MKRIFARLALLSALLMLLPALLSSAADTGVLSPAGDLPGVWLSARPGKTNYTHDLRLILSVPKNMGNGALSLTLSFQGTHAPASQTARLNELATAGTIRAGETIYSATQDAELRVWMLTGIDDGSYDSLTLTLSSGDRVLHSSTQSAKVIADSADLLLTPWDLSLTDWMAALPDRTSLAELTIPGTHDSGADEVSVLSKYSQCQSLSITDQLCAGVRLLDIRLKLQSETLKVYHGPTDQKLTFDEVLSECQSFLADHPNEVVLMSIKQEDDDNASFPSAVDKAIRACGDLFFTENRLPTLGESRGKIVLLRRYGGANIGINCADGFADNTAFSMNNGVSMKVQDFYAVSSTDNIDRKWTMITDLASTAQKENGVFCLNFVSGYTTGLFSLPDIQAVSNVLNPRLLAYAQALPRGGYGVFLCDYITPELASALIATNFPG